MSDCKHENTTFEGSLGAPGFGQSYSCNDCGEALWALNATAEKRPFKDLEESDFIMSKEDVI